MNNLKQLLKTINEMLGKDPLGKDLISLDKSYGGYKVELSKGYGTTDLSKRATKKEITFFLEGMLKALELTKRE